MTDVYVFVLGGIDDPARPSGGNVYDRQVCLGLTGLGWSVHERPMSGAWPDPGSDARAAVADQREHARRPVLKLQQTANYVVNFRQFVKSLQIGN